MVSKGFVRELPSGAWAMALACLLAAPSIAGAQALRPETTYGAPRFIRVGHDNIVVDPTVRRYTGMVAGLGVPGSDGKLYTLKTAPVGPRGFALSPNELRGWRLTVLSGKRFGQAFTVGGNTASEITVTSDKGGLDGLGVRDVFIVESIDANGVSMFGPPGSPPIPPGT